MVSPMEARPISTAKGAADLKGLESRTHIQGKDLLQIYLHQVQRYLMASQDPGNYFTILLIIK